MKDENRKKKIKIRKYVGDRPTIIKPIMLKTHYERANHVTVEIKGKDPKEIEQITETIKKTLLNEERHIENGVSFTIYRCLKI